MILSCKEININKEIQYARILDSVLTQQESLTTSYDTTKINNYIKTSEERIVLFESPILNNIEKKWLHHEKKVYQNISHKLRGFNKNVEGLYTQLNYSKFQINALKKDLIHRHINKNEFQQHFTEEQKALAKISATNKNLNKIYQENTNEFDSLEHKLEWVLSQLNELNKKYGNSTKK